MDITKARSWIITQNFKDGIIPDAKTWLEDLFHKSKASYVVGQLEQGTEEQTYHIQAFLNFSNTKAFGGLKKLIPFAHIEAVKREQAAEAYCMKTETRIEGPFEFGIKPVRRNNKDDWEEVLEKAKDGRFAEIPASILVQNYGNITKLYKDHMKVEDSKHLRGIFIFGQSGVGKSTLARGLFPGRTIYNKAHNKWWDSYKGEKIVIWDDLSPEEAKISGTHLKLYCDRFGIMGETKGSGVPLTYDYFIMTSQYSFEECFEDSKLRDAIFRRTYVFEMTKEILEQFDMELMYQKLHDESNFPDIEKHIKRSKKMDVEK